MITFSPERKNKNISGAIVLISLISAVIFAYLSRTVKSYAAIFQLMIVISLTVTIQIYVRYIATSYRYIIEDDNFIVYKKVGKKEVVVCDLTLRTALGIVDKSSAANIERNFGKIGKKYNYCVSIFPPQCYFFIFEFNGVRGVISFEADNNFYNFFKSKINSYDI